MKENRTKFLADIDKLREKIVRPEGFLNRLFDYHYYAFSGELQTDYYEKVRYEYLQVLMTLPARDILNFMLFSNAGWVFNINVFNYGFGGLGISPQGLWSESSDLWHQYTSENTEIFKRIDNIRQELQKKYRNKPRVRLLANRYESDMDVLRTKAHAILQVQVEFIQNTYKNKQGKTKIPGSTT